MSNYAPGRTRTAAAVVEAALRLKINADLGRPGAARHALHELAGLLAELDALLAPLPTPQEDR